MSLPIEQIKQLAEETNKDLDVILDRRIYELGLNTLRMYMTNHEEEPVLVENLLILIESYSKKIDIKAFKLQEINSQLKNGSIDFDLDIFEDNFYTNKETLKVMGKKKTIKYTREFINDMIDFYNENLLTEEDLTPEEED